MNAAENRWVADKRPHIGDGLVVEPSELLRFDRQAARAVTAASVRTARRRRWRPLGVISAAVFVLVAFGVALLGGDRDDAGARRRVESYQAELLPLVKEWGRIEVQGMRPAIADLLSGQGVPPETVAGEAQAWRAGFEDLRQKIRALDPPEALEDAERLFDRSMQRYLDATFEFEQAAEGAGAARTTGIERGTAAAGDGARLYNEASLVLQRARQKVGLPPTDEFPEHPAGREDVSEDVKER